MRTSVSVRDVDSSLGRSNAAEECRTESTNLSDPIQTVKYIFSVDREGIELIIAYTEDALYCEGTPRYSGH
jgi:hypothetical protein